jgi:CheY-like chemotaxis protein
LYDLMAAARARLGHLCDGEALEAAEQTARLRILVADDDAWMRRLLARSLAAAGHDVSVVGDGRALEAAVFGPGMHDLVISDQQMPGGTGLEVLRRLREAQSAIAFVLMSGDADGALRAEAERLGAHVLPKPIDADALRLFIARASVD